MKFIHYIILLTISLLTISAGYADEAEDIINDLKKKYDSVNNLSAEFTQDFYWNLADESQQQRGSIILSGNDNFKIETSDQIIVSDGKSIWTYSKSNNQVIIDALENNQEVTLPRDLFMKFSKDYKPFKLGDEIIDGIACHVIRLTSKNDNAYIKEMKVWIDKKSTVTKKIQHTDISDNVTVYLLNNVQLNRKIDPAIFRFQAPAGVEKIDLR